ncbi:MAG: hypothetical protein ISS79_11465 [Phycisphaerae bacterium]|nr:hypothetical protein [Phycisphaerae bacterium]
MSQENEYKYYLSDDCGTSIEIEKKRYENLCLNNQIVLFHLLFEEQYQICKYNFMEYWQTIFKVSETFRLDCPYDRKSMTLPSLEINQRVLNILTSIESYEDHIGEKVSKLWGRSSKEAKRFKEIDRDLYDKFLSYRFLKRLQNYAKHHDLPVKCISYPVMSVGFEPRQIAFTATPIMYKNYLLKFDSWSAMKKDIEEGDDEIDVNLIMEEAFRVFTTLHAQFRDYLSEMLEQARRTVTELYESKEGRSKDGLYLVKGLGDKAIEHQWVQYDDIEIIKELIERGPKTEAINFSTAQPEKYLKGISKIASDMRLANMIKEKQE